MKSTTQHIVWYDEVMGTYSVITANLDFTLPARKVKKDLDFIDDRANAILFQEAKNVDVGKLLKGKSWRAFQRRGTAAKAGSGIAFDRKAFKAHNRGLKLGTTPRGFKMLPRYISWISVSERVNDKKRADFRFVSVHIPPNRYRVLVPIMLGSLRIFIKASRFPLIIGGDWNMNVENDYRMKRLARQVGGSLHGHGIDGFLVVNKKNAKNRIRVQRTHRTKQTNSDHAPVRMVFDVLKKRKKNK